MICGNTSDFIDHPLPKYFESAHGASHHAWTPGLPPSKSGAGVKCDCSVQRIGTNTNNLTASKHATICCKIFCVFRETGTCIFVAEPQSYPFSPACDTFLAELCNPITRQAIEVESCSNPLRIQQVL